MYRAIFQMNLGQIIHSVTQFGLNKIMRNHSIEQFAIQLYAILRQHQQIKFDVLPYFLYLLTFENDTKLEQYMSRFFFVFGQRNIVGLPFSKTKRKPYQIG